MKTKFKNSNRILSFVLSLVMVVGLLPMSTLTAFAADEHSHPICGSTHTDIGDHTAACSNMAWTKWESTNSMPTEAGAYYLAENVILSSTWEIPEGVEISLCLNGHSVSGNNAVRVATVNKTATLNLCDCSSEQTGKITEGYRSDYSGAGVWVDTGSTFNLYGGSIENNRTTYQGGGVYIFNGTFNMYGGSISDNTAFYGAGVYNNSGTINIYVGDITKNKASMMGGGVFNSGKFYMTGGNISANEVTGYQQYCDGGGVYFNIGSFEMSGGTISQNIAENGAGICVGFLKKWLVSGNPVINDAIYWGSNSGTAYITVCGALNDGASFAATNRGVGETIVIGTDTYSITENDTAKFATNEGTIYLDSVGNRLVLCNDAHPEYEDGACKTCGAECKHSIVYESNQNVITERCNAESNCGHEEKATLSANSQIYSGTALTPATITYSDGWWGEKIEDSAITYSNNIDAGTATASVVIEKKTISTTFQINAADIANATITLNPASGDYDGNEQKPTVSVIWNGNPLTENTNYTVSWDKNGFINADTYTATIEGIGNFENEKTATFIITDADITVIEVKQKYTLTYNGKEQTPTVSTSATSVNNQPITFEYSTEKGNYGAMPTFKETGTYTVYYRATADNHIAAYGDFTVTINKQTVDVPNITSKEYNGETQTADIESTDIYTVTENNGGTDARKYNVVLTLTDSKNYKWGPPETTENAAITLDFEITKATNEWMPEPTISGWTYGDTASTPNGAAKFGTVKVVYTGEANDGSDYNSETAPTKAGSYKATFTVTGYDNYTGLEKAVDFEIEKATYDMSGAKWDYTTAFNYDGKSHTVWFDEDSLPDGVTVSRYTENTDSQVGKHTANVAFAYDYNNYNPPIFNTLFDWEIVNNWTPTEYTVTKLNDNGWINGDFEITPQDGYKIATDNKDTSEWSNKLTYSAETDSDEVTFYLRNTDNDEISLAKTVSYKLDKTDPTGTVEFVGREPWQELVNKITFGLFFKEEVTVKITANDTLSDIASIEYYEADELMTLDEVKAITNWTAYNDSFGVSVEDTKKFIYFVRITDNAGNVTYLSTDGAEYDTTDPKIEGVENNGIYYVTQKVTVKDKNLDTVTLNDTPVTLDGNGSFTLTGNTEAQYKIVATDKAGNSKTITVTMKAISAIKAPINDKTTDNIKSADGDTVQSVIDNVAELLTDPDITDSEKAELEQIKETAETLKDKIGSTTAENTDITNKVGEYKPESVKSDDTQDIKDLIGRIDTLLDGDNLTEDEKAALEETKTEAQDLLDKIDEAANADDTDNTEKVKDITADNVTPEDKSDLEKAKDDLTKTLDDYSDNLTEDEKKAIEDEIDRIDKAIAIIENVEAVEDKIGSLPENITKNDEVAIKAADEAYNALSDYEKSIVDKDAKKALDDAKAALAELNKPADTTSPNTGDSSNMFLWIALLFISGGAVITLTVVDRKRRTASKR